MGGQWGKDQSAHRRKVVIDTLAKFPNEGHRTLARKLTNEEPLLFPSLEIARSALRYATGNSGPVNRRSAPRTRAPRKPGELHPLPESMAKPWVPYVLDARRVLVLADIHLPFHDSAALNLALQYGDKFKPDAILLNGDVFDFYQISRFDKDPNEASVPDELAVGAAFFAHLRQRFRKAHIVFRYGNHDRRWDLYLMRNAPALFNMQSVLDVWHKDAGIVDAGVTVVRQQCPVMVGNLPIFHGDELPKGMSSPVNPARGAFLRTLSSLLHSHLHRTSEHNESTMDGRHICCRTTGCLCDKSPAYARINKWDSGFATVEVAQDGGYEVELKRIIEGRVR